MKNRYGTIWVEGVCTQAVKEAGGTLGIAALHFTVTTEYHTGNLCSPFPLSFFCFRSPLQPLACGSPLVLFLPPFFSNLFSLSPPPPLPFFASFVLFSLVSLLALPLPGE